jgi:Protein of unknown function (DUF2550)
MPLWQWVADGVGAALLLVLLFGLGIVLRRRWVSRSGGTFELSFRQPPAGHALAVGRSLVQPPGAVEPGAVSTTPATASARGWTLGIGRYSGDVLECFRIFSLSPRPRRRLDRGAVTYLGQRVPQGMEVHAIYAGHVIIACSTPRGLVELALAPDALTGLLAWLEASPPGRHGLVL